MRRLAYLVKEALTNIRLNRTTTLVAVASTAFTLACFGVFLLLYLNLRGVVSSLQEDIKVVVYLHDGLSAQGLSDLQQRLKSEREVAALSYVSKERALADFREQFPSEYHLLQGLGENPLPASFVVTLSPRFRSSETIKQWAKRLSSMSGVAQVQYSRDWIENLGAVIGFIELGAVAVGGILSAASVTIIASTIRLTLYARREEIEILGLVGATRAFIRIPYLLEGAVLGAVGSLLSLAILRGGFDLFKLQLGPTGRFLGVESWLNFFPGHVSLWIIVAGLALGFTGSLVSLIQFGRASS